VDIINICMGVCMFEICMQLYPHVITVFDVCQGTIAAELTRQLDHFDCIMVPVGGGGMCMCVCVCVCVCMCTCVVCVSLNRMRCAMYDR